VRGSKYRAIRNEPEHELGHPAFRRSPSRMRSVSENREDAVANPFCPVASIFPTGF
jgi:hypothetical protein